MSRFFDELGERLRSSTAEQHAPAPRAERSPRSHRRRWARRRPLIAMVIAACGLAVPAAGAVSNLWQPDVEPAPPLVSTVESDTPGPFSCSAPWAAKGIDVGPPVGAEFTSVPSVLGRPSTPADTLGEARFQLIRLIDVDLASTRNVGAADGRPMFAVAARGRHMTIPPDCQHNLGRRDRERYLAANDGLDGPTICLVGGPGGCALLDDFRQRGIYSAQVPRGEPATVAGLVPDGVRAVHVTYGRSTRAFPVNDNFFTFNVAVEGLQAATPDRLQWEMEDGSMRDVAPPTLGPPSDDR